MQSECLKNATSLHVGLITIDASLGQQVDQTLADFGYLTSRFEHIRHIDPVNSHGLHALILDLPDATQAEPLLLQIRHWQQAQSTSLPLLVISHYDTFELRLHAIRAGTRGFFNKPLNLISLENRLDHCLLRRHEAPYRVMIIDDDIALTTRYQFVLRHAGIDAHTVNDPRQALEAMHALRPEVILLDVNMPLCSGPELAQMIRLDEDWLRVPIIYLSAETNTQRQSLALLHAGDDFITKPILDNALVNAVFARAQRARAMSDALARDSLTGLLKHNDIKEHIGMGLARSQRTQEATSVAMIDIDHFKHVNDRHGHLIGDGVIRMLSNLLRQRLRKTDSIGRYGGDEFVVVLANCQQADAVALIEEIRESFAHLHYAANGQKLQVTFSAGVATASSHDSVRSLLDRADKALYVAKQQGRNQTQKG